MRLESQRILYRYFSTVYAVSEGKEYFRDYCVPRFRTARKDSERTMGMQKASMQAAGAKQCYAFVTVRIKRIDIATAEETSARRNIGSRKMFLTVESDGRSRTNGKVSERVGGRKRWLEYACASDSKMTIMLILWLPFESVNSCSNRLIAIGKCVRGKWWEGCIYNILRDIHRII